MASPVKTYLFCFDDHRNFSEDVKKRFSDQSKYLVVTFHNREDFLKNLLMVKDSNQCKIAIITLQDSKENFEVTDNLIAEIKKIDVSTGIILLGNPGKIDEIKRTIRVNVDSYVPRNTNQVLRIHNTVKKLMSEHSLLIFRRRRNFSFYFLLVFLAIAFCALIVSYFKFPLYF
jgi:DNA-binding NarL/FixJ family response regulator